MATSNQDKDDSAYVQLNALIHDKSIKFIVITKTISIKLLAFCVKGRQLRLNHINTGN